MRWILFVFALGACWHLSIVSIGYMRYEHPTEGVPDLLYWIAGVVVGGLGAYQVGASRWWSVTAAFALTLGLPVLVLIQWVADLVGQ